MTTDYDSALAEVKAFAKLQAALPDGASFRVDATPALFAFARKLDRETGMEELTDRLSRTLEFTGKDTLEIKLCQQAQVLDAAFLWLMTQIGVDDHASSKRYQSAFQAQKLFRQSLQVLNTSARQKSAERTIKRTEQKKELRRAIRYAENMHDGNMDDGNINDQMGTLATMVENIVGEDN